MLKLDGTDNKCKSLKYLDIFISILCIKIIQLQWYMKYRNTKNENIHE